MGTTAGVRRLACVCQGFYEGIEGEEWKRLCYKGGAQDGQHSEIGQQSSQGKGFVDVVRRKDKWGSVLRSEQRATNCECSHSAASAVGGAYAKLDSCAGRGPGQNRGRGGKGGVLHRRVK